MSRFFLPMLLMACMVQGPAAVLVHGHRGARARRPENTIPAFRYAVEAGADFLEMDVAVTKDNVLVISHDPHINPEICEGPRPGVLIRSLTMAEVQSYDCGAKKNPRFGEQQPVPRTRIPALDEVLRLGANSTVQFNIETKSFPEHPDYTPPPEEFARMLLDTIHRRGLESRVIIQSFDFRTLHAAKKLAPRVRLAALWEGDGRPFTAIAQEAGAGIVSPMSSLVNHEQVRAAHAAGLQVVPWAVNEPRDWDRMIDAGVDAMISDDPAALLAYLKRRGLH